MSEGTSKNSDWDVRPIIKAIEEKASTPEGRREIARDLAESLAKPLPMFGEDQQEWEIDWNRPVDTMPRDACLLP